MPTSDVPIRLIGRFIAANQRLCDRLEARLPEARSNILVLYEKTVSRFISEVGRGNILDVGGGRLCLYADFHLQRRAGTDCKKARVVVPGT